MSNKQKVTVAFGKANFARAMGTLGAFHVTAPFERTTAVTSGRCSPKDKSWAPSTDDSSGGGFTTARVEYEEGEVLLFQARRTRNGMPIADGAVFIRIRANGPMFSLLMALPQDPESMLGDNLLAFQGCGDILSVEELRVLGIEVSRSYASNYMDEDEIKELYTVKEIRAAAVERPTLIRSATSTGVKVQAMAAEPQRRVRLRRS